MGYKRFSLLGALITAVILMTGSVLVILENITKMFHPQPVNDKGILWLGIIAVTINVLASLVVRKGKTKNESILSLHFLEDTLGWLAVILMAIILRFTDWYILDPLLSLVISFFILSKAIPRFLVYSQDFLGCCARRSRYQASQESPRAIGLCCQCQSDQSLDYGWFGEKRHYSCLSRAYQTYGSL